MAKHIALLPQQFHATALSFPDKVRAFLNNNPPLNDSIKALRGGDGLLLLARDLDASAADINAIQRGRFHIIAHIGELLPAAPPSERGAKGGRGKKATSPPEVAFAPATLAAYRKVTKHREAIDPFFDSLPDEMEDKAVGLVAFIRHTTGHEKAGRAAHVSANTGIPEWYTPAEYIDAARSVMGGIDLDPASSAIAQKTVKAKRFYSIDDDGLKKSWAGAVWMNPPYTAGLVDKFTGKLCEHFSAGDVTQAIVILNNATETTWFQNLAAHSSALCFPAQRVKFLDENGKPGAPLQGQALLYLGTRYKSFTKRFSAFGFCALTVR